MALRRTPSWLAAVLLILAVAVPATILGWKHQSKLERQREVVRMSVGEAWALGADAVWVDARSPRERAEGVIPGAWPLTEADWDHELGAVASQWGPRKTFVVYCGVQACATSRAIALRLKEAMPEARVVTLEGGWEAWLAAKSGRRP